MLAGLLGWPQGTFAAKAVIADDKKVRTWGGGGMRAAASKDRRASSGTSPLPGARRLARTARMPSQVHT